MKLETKNIGTPSNPRNKKMLKILFWAMLTVIGGLFVFCNILDAFTGSLFTITICLFISTFFLDDKEVLTVKISIPLGVLFFILFLAIPLPALFFKDNAIFGLGGTLALVMILVVLCAWLGGKLVRRG